MVGRKIDQKPAHVTSRASYPTDFWFKQAAFESNATYGAKPVPPYMFRDAMLKLLLAETLPYAKLIED